MSDDEISNWYEIKAKEAKRLREWIATLEVAGALFSEVERQQALKVAREALERAEYVGD